MLYVRLIAPLRLAHFNWVASHGGQGEDPLAVEEENRMITWLTVLTGKKFMTIIMLYVRLIAPLRLAHFNWVASHGGQGVEEEKNPQI